VRKLLVRRVLLGLAVPVAITGTRALAARAAARPGSSAYAPRLHRVADLLERPQGGHPPVPPARPVTRTPTPQRVPAP